jgi:tetratricopeptide (TPR) repeat protein
VSDRRPEQPGATLLAALAAQARGDHAETERLCRGGLDEPPVPGRLGRQHRDGLLHLLAQAYEAQGRRSDATAAFEALLAERPAAGEADDALLADLCVRLARLYEADGRAAEAAALYRRLLLSRLRTVMRGSSLIGASDDDVAAARARFAAWEREFGPAHPVLFEALVVFASRALQDRDLAAARTALERALAIAERYVEPHDPALGALLAILLGVCGKLEDHVRARALAGRLTQLADRVRAAATGDGGVPGKAPRE